MRKKHFENKARQSYWRVHTEAWRQSGLSVRAYAETHRLYPKTFHRWIRLIAGEDEVRQHQKTLAEQRRERTLAKRRLKPARRRFGISTDTKERGLWAFWAMHVEAMNWSGMGIREYAASFDLSPTSLRKWRDRVAEREDAFDWRAHLPPSARPVSGTSANGTTLDCGLTDPAEAVETPSSSPSPRRFFSDEAKRAIALESDAPGVSVSAVARKYGLVSGLLFRWRVQFGITQKKHARLACAVNADGTPLTLEIPNLTLADVDSGPSARPVRPAGPSR